MNAWERITETLGVRLFATCGLHAKRSNPVPLRHWEPPPPPPTPPPELKPREASKYGLKDKKKKKKEYRSRYDIDLDSLDDEDHGEHLTLEYEVSSGGFLCCGRQSSVIEPEHSKGEITKDIRFQDVLRKRPSVYDRLARTEDREDLGEDDDAEVDEDASASLDHGSAETDPITGEKIKKKRVLSEEEIVAIERRKEKQSKRIRKKKMESEKNEFVEKVVEVFDPLARYNVTFPSFGRLKGLPMSLAFMKSSHAKRGYDIVVQRKTKRLTAMKEMVLAGGVDTVALNSGPDANLIPGGFVISGSIPLLDSSFNGEIVMLLWEQEMNIDQFRLGEPLLGWFTAKVHAHCDRPPHNFILKYSKEVTGTRKLDGFVSTVLGEAGFHGYGRRWVWLVPENSRPVTRGSGETPLTSKEADALKKLSGGESIEGEKGDMSANNDDDDVVSNDYLDDDEGSGAGAVESQPQRQRQISQASQPNGYGSVLGSKENGGDQWNSNSRIE